MPVLSVLDFATIFDGETPRESFKRSVALAQHAEQLGFERIWYAEHHNMKSIASSAPAVLISHVGAKTSKIRLGSGGVMLPNHSPLVVAEQFGTLAELYPNRIDLGLGRAPGTDPKTLKALRRDYSAAEHFPQDVKELQGYLTDNTQIPGINAVPGRGTNVPLYILGSSLFGASLAAALGLPYAFASHFAPTHLEEAIKVYRERFNPSEQLAEPYVIAAVNVIASDTAEDAQAQLEKAKRSRVKNMVGQGRDYSEAEIDMLMNSAPGQQILSMLKYTTAGTAAEVKDYLMRFAHLVEADELMLSPLSPTTEGVHKTLDIVAEQMI
ncbi:LLM class flavin-dependent oxidoreductase [Rothia amarae]|uniref:LLM class flavin-dependent oxidoreductase n=1 Tax=Rothia amarae TaxID=169480 RepID=A0A7H2BJM6_9MICC|nr:MULTISPECIES: LLM class flavin-dependent oxidoreductase [Rothia]QNV39872.1 LLM class flavin-dependent oxidoreductase [Rothia amarae]